MSCSLTKVCLLPAVILIGATLLYAAAPPLRDELNLAGSWGGGNVPSATKGGSSLTLTRNVVVPAAWAGKRVFLDIETLNWGDVTSVNGTRVGTSTGGWLPHSYDITSQVTAGQSCTITMVTPGGTAPSGWPSGFPLNNANWGNITYDVYLRAYGMVAIRDAEIITSVANSRLTVKYELQNFSASSRTVTIGANAYPSTGGASAASLSTSTTLSAGQTKIVEVSTPWTNPNLWFPTDPKLYHLCSAVKESGATIDSQTVRFGFREMKISGRYLMLNGIRVNCRGESNEMNSSNLSSATNGRNFALLQKSVNANSVRFHGKPAPDFVMDEFDEQGIMVMNEAPIWQNAGQVSSSVTKTIWYPAWVKHARNHASLVHWSAQNESYGLSEADALAAVQIIHASDGSNRPVWHEDVRHRGLPTECKHYPEGYQNLPNGGMMYAAGWVENPAVPQSVGEFVIQSMVSDRAAGQYWQGHFSRGMRYANISVIHPYVYFEWVGSNAGARAHLKNSYAPVALFDHDYDGLGIGPVKDSDYPSITAGSTANRSLDLYNDEFADNVVSVQVDVVSGGVIRASGTKSYLVELGSHIAIPCSFQVPFAGGSTMDLVLTTRKGGAAKFTETKRFNVTGATSGTSTATVTLGGNGIEPTTPYMQLSPSSVSVTGSTGANVADRVISLTNGAGGTLAAPTTRIVYGAGSSGWITPVAGGSGNSRSITLQFATSALSGGTFTAQLIVKSAGALPDSVVCPITLTQTGPDLTGPRISRASGTGAIVVVVFDEPVEQASATNAANYALNNSVAISAATLAPDNVTVTLTTSALINGTVYTVTVNNVRDRAPTPNTVAANTRVTFTAARTITKIRFYPRPGMAARMNSGRFEGTTGAVDGTYLTMHTIAGAPTDGQWTEVSTLQNGDAGFSAVRYNSPDGFGNVAEVEFYAGDLKLTGTPYGTAGTWGGSSSDFTKVFDGDITTYFDCSSAAAHAGLILRDVAVRDKPIAAPGASLGALTLRFGEGALAVRVSVQGVARTSSVCVSIYDIRGSLVIRESLGMTKAGSEIALSDRRANRLSPGQYIIEVQAGSTKAMSRFGVMR